LKLHFHGQQATCVINGNIGTRVRGIGSTVRGNQFFDAVIRYFFGANLANIMTP